MTDIPSNEQYIQLEGAQFRSPTGENLFQTIGGSVNWLLDQVISLNSSITSVAHMVAQFNTTNDFTLTPATNVVITSVPGTIIGIAYIGASFFNGTSTVPFNNIYFQNRFGVTLSTGTDYTTNNNGLEVDPGGGGNPASYMVVNGTNVQIFWNESDTVTNASMTFPFLFIWYTVP